MSSRHDRMCRRLRQSCEQLHELRILRSELPRRTGLPERSVWVPNRPNDLLGDLRGHLLGREELRCMRPGLREWAGLFAKSLRFRLRERPDSLWYVLRGHDGKLSRLRQLREGMPERSIVLDERLHLPDR